MEEKSEYSLELKEIAELENKADKLHRKFLQQIFAEEIDFKVFSQATLVDQILEDIIDDVERLSRQIFLFLNEYKTIGQASPSYLP